MRRGPLTPVADSLLLSRRRPGWLPGPRLRSLVAQEGARCAAFLVGPSTRRALLHRHGMLDFAIPLVRDGERCGKCGHVESPGTVVVSACEHAMEPARVAQEVPTWFLVAIEYLRGSAPGWSVVEVETAREQRSWRVVWAHWFRPRES